MPSIGSQESNMPDTPAHHTHWKRVIDDRLAALRVAAPRRLEVVEELSQHLQDRYDELVAGGVDAAAAREAVLAELESPQLLRELTDVERSAPADPLPLGASGPNL